MIKKPFIVLLVISVLLNFYGFSNVSENELITNIDSSLHSPQKKTLSKRKQRKELIKFAETLIGKPYRYGGNTPKGFDCSGFTQYTYKHIGVELPHGSTNQSKLGKKTKLRKAKPGDLIFFGEKNKRKKKTKINHVAMVYNTKSGVLSIIHASSQGIRIDDENGTNWQSYWKQRVLFVRRIIR